VRKGRGDGKGILAVNPFFKPNILISPSSIKPHLTGIFLISGQGKEPECLSNLAPVSGYGRA
jgi:hypothetical protein